MSDLAERAKQHFGVTRDPREAGYILPDGTMLDLSGRHHAANDFERDPETNTNRAKRGRRDYLQGSRQTDHRELGDLVPGDSTAAMRNFMRQTGAIRFFPDNGFEIVTKPTPRQLAMAIACHMTITEDPLHVDVADPVTGENRDSRSFVKPSVGAIVRFVTAALADPITEDATGGIEAFHGSFGELRQSFRSLTHFGSRKAAEDRIAAVRKEASAAARKLKSKRFAPWEQASLENKVAKQAGEPAVYAVRLDLRNPARIKDAPVQHSPSQIAFGLRDRKIVSQDEMLTVTTAEPSDQVQRLIDLLRSKGHDGVVYTNRYEDKGSDSYVILDPKQVLSVTKVGPTQAVTEAVASDWVRIADLSPEARRRTLDAFAKLADDQRGVPEDMGGGGRGNPHIFHANGLFTFHSEHVGDLTHRMAARHHDEIHYGYEYVGKKVDSAVRDLRRAYGFGREVEGNLRSNFKYRQEQGDFSGTYEEWLKLFERAADRYADAHSKLTVYNPAQWHAREAAVALGRRQYDAMRNHLEALKQWLDQSPEEWDGWASRVRLDPAGNPIPYRGGSLTEAEDPDAYYRPQPMAEPKVLYRSVSLPELLDVVQARAINGRQNRFNPFDARRHVFFGDRMDASLIGQGEETERQASTAIGDHPIHQKFEELQATVRQVRQQTLDLVQKRLERINRDRIANGWKPMEVDAETAERFMNGEWSATGKVQELAFGPEARKMFAEIASLERKEKKLRDQYNALHDRHRAAIEQKLEKLSVTSAVLETRPIDGGLHYSDAHGRSGMSSDEFGFRPGQVTLDDITKVHFIRKGQVVEVISARDLPAALVRLGLLGGSRVRGDEITL